MINRFYTRIVFLAGCLLVCGVFVYGFVNTSRPVKRDVIDLTAYDWNTVAQKRNIIPIAVIGSGPAGLNAAMYGARAGIKSVIFEGYEPLGLLMKTTDVSNYLGAPNTQGPKLMETSRKQAADFGVKFVGDVIESVDFSRWPYELYTGEGETVHALTVIITTGAAPRYLGVPGEEDYKNKGVSACARCDALCYRDKEVVVIGGGDSAIEEALQLEPYAKKVTIIHRRDKFRAAPQVQQRIESLDKVNTIWNAKVNRVIGDESSVTAVELEDMQTGKKSVFPTDGMFLAIGHVPATQMFKDYIALDEQGFIQLEGRSQATNLPGVYAAGDVADPSYRQAITAAGDGGKAGMDAIFFLQQIGFTTARAQEFVKSKKMFSGDE